MIEWWNWGGAYLGEGKADEFAGGADVVIAACEDGEEESLKGLGLAVLDVCSRLSMSIREPRT